MLAKSSRQRESVSESVPINAAGLSTKAGVYHEGLLIRYQPPLVSCGEFCQVVAETVCKKCAEKVEGHWA